MTTGQTSATPAARKLDSPGHLLRCGLLVLICVASFLPGIFSLPPTDRDESRYIQATRQMLATGDFVDIRFQDKPRYLQPAGIYWFQSGIVSIVAGGESPTPIWAHRLASTLGAILAVLATYAAGFRLFGVRAAMLGAIGMTGIVMLGFEARIAKTDATLLAACTVAMAALAHVYLGARQMRPISRAAPALFWLAVATGLMVKGPIILALTGLCAAALSLLDRDLRWLAPLRPLLGAAIVLALTLPWLIAVNMRSDGEFLRVALGRSMMSKITSGQESHGFPPGYFIVVGTATLWPFALEAVKGFLKGLNIGRLDPRIAFCLAWIIPFWIVFELIPTKLPHYVLPTYPALLLLAGWALSEGAARHIRHSAWQVWAIRLATLGWALVTIGLAVLFVIGPPLILDQWTYWGLAGGLLVLLAGWLGGGRPPNLPALPRFGAAAIANAMAFGIATGVILPRAEYLWMGKVIADAFHASKPCERSVLISAGFHEPSLVVLAGTETVLTYPQDAASRLAQNACNVAAVRESELEAFLGAYPGNPEDIRRERVSGFDYTKGVNRDIFLITARPR